LKLFSDCSSRTHITLGKYIIITGGFNGRPLVQWPTRPLEGWALEAPGPRGGGGGRLNFGLQLQSPDCNLN